MTTQQSADNSLQQVTLTLDILFNELGHKKARDFLKLCIYQLTHASRNLDQHINDKDWDKAKMVTHRLLGSSNLYASMKLQLLLQSIEVGIVSGPNLEQAFLEVQTELSLLLNQIKEKVET